MTQSTPLANVDLLRSTDKFIDRHIGPKAGDIQQMLRELDVSTLEELVDQAVPRVIRMEGKLDLPEAMSESEILADLLQLAEANEVFRSYIGLGYSNCVTPPVIQRNILENPGWYTQYTPYQAEIAQGRLEALLNFQTMIGDLTGMEIANASLLDEGTAAAEAMTFCQRLMPRKSEANTFFVSSLVHPQTIDVITTRAESLGINVIVGVHDEYDFADETFGVLVQYPTTDGSVLNYESFFDRAHEAGAMTVVAADLLALVLLRSPGQFGTDVVVGNSQRFGVPLGFGGPHAAYMATLDKFQRQLPGRLVGVSVDSAGGPAYRLALQTREQHIRRDKATSNICTAQVLLAVIASMYAVYHGPEGLRKIARRVRLLTEILAEGLNLLGYDTGSEIRFDTVTVKSGPLDQKSIVSRALDKRINLRSYDNGQVGISLDESTSVADLEDLFTVFGTNDESLDVEELAGAVAVDYPEEFERTTDYLTHPVFHRFHSETEMLRYIHRLQARDLSLTHSMIPLGSCTMKLNSTAEMYPISWPGFAQLHPFAPSSQTLGYQKLLKRLETWLAEITGFATTSLQPNAGSQGEYTGLLVIRAYHISRAETHRNICLIPGSAHGTNPASAVLAGLEVVVVKTDENGNIDVDDLRSKAEKHSDNLAALMVTYPSTHGVFEEAICEIGEIVHNHGGQVYLDGANLNALVGIARPGDFGADVCHLNLHKTFCIPHGGGGPGMGPICVAEHLAPFLPGHSVVPGVGGEQATGAVSSAPWGSPSILPIPYAYIAMMGESGLTRATQVAILNANYIATRLDPYFPVLYKGINDRVAHECIIDVRPYKESAGIIVDDVAKRLMDYGFHAPTMSFPVPGTLMIEPTESESLEELDRFCNALIAIRQEIQEVIDGEIAEDNNPLKGAPHTAKMIAADVWDRPYSRRQAAFPASWVEESKFWPAVARIDNVYGDRNLFCVCIPMEEYEES
ncbi:MAG TPA: aminomethyl-transferring glycine dehydrogenase [candidate division Zixibacteria bacterium]|nr:aminomethyl-transferring glycine dehydrogenase [candidate division Zixibacteria bacterium]